MTKEEIHKQNMQDMITVIAILFDILWDKELTPRDEERSKYASKVLYNVIDKLKKDASN